MADHLPSAAWRRSTFSSSVGECVELAASPDGHRTVRDSKLGDGSPVLMVPTGQWAAFTEGIRDGRFD
ncbi:MAG: DUF397 domain-containing protein [Pseudonocardiaceae bacterium]